MISYCKRNLHWMCCPNPMLAKERYHMGDMCDGTVGDTPRADSYGLLLNSRWSLLAYAMGEESL